MADLSKIKVGDKLRFTGEVSTVTKSGVAVHIEGAATHSTWVIPFSGSTLEAAEHIPAPRVFKRGDWVRWKGDHTKRMVVADKGESLWVTSDDHAKNIIWRKQDCELTEAPE